MEYLENEKLYNALENDNQIDFDVKNWILSLLESDPNLVHKTYKYLRLQEDAMKTEKLRLQEIQKDKKLKADLIKDTILQYLQDSNKKNIETSIGKISRRATPGKVQIIDITNVPDEYFKLERTPKLTDIKQGIQSGKISEDIAVLKKSETVTIS